MSRFSQADVVVLGGGIIGTNIALALAERAAGRVVLLEKSALGAGSTGKSGAILRQHYGNPVTVAMARESLHFYADFERRYGDDIGFRQPGMVFFARAEEREALEANVALQRELGVTAQVLGAAELRGLFPGAHIPDELVGAWEPEAAYVDPLATVRAVGRAAEACGVELRLGTRVEELLISGGEAYGVRLAGGDWIEAPTVVNAGGPWARRLLGPLGDELPLRAVRPQQAFFEPSPAVGEALPIVADLQLDLYWKPEPKGWTRVGRMSFDADAEVPDPDRYDEGVDGGFLAACRDGVAERQPGFGEAVSWGGCGALYTVTPDAHPLIGEVPGVRGLFLASGFSGHGFKLGPSVGAGVAGLVAGDVRPPFDPDFFAVDRVRRGRPIRPRYAYGILG
ncbi:MAG: FAD-dependent oxidoreductase [Planctomycetota bacterium]